MGRLESPPRSVEEAREEWRSRDEGLSDDLRSRERLLDLLLRLPSFPRSSRPLVLSRSLSLSAFLSPPLRGEGDRESETLCRLPWRSSASFPLEGLTTSESLARAVEEDEGDGEGESEAVGPVRVAVICGEPSIL